VSAHGESTLCLRGRSIDSRPNGTVIFFRPKKVPWLRVADSSADSSLSVVHQEICKYVNILELGDSTLDTCSKQSPSAEKGTSVKKSEISPQIR
jgi:hypothetical protein